MEGNTLIPKKVFYWPGYLLFFSMLFVPTVYQAPRGILLMLVVGSILVASFLNGYPRLHYTVLLWVLFMVSIGLFFMLRGLVNGAPGALRVGTVYVIWPLVYALLVAGAARQAVVDAIFRTILVASIAIGTYGLVYVLYSAGWWPAALYIPIDQGQAIGFYDGYIEINLYSLSSLLFLVPFLIASLMCWQKEYGLPVPSHWLWVALIICFMLVLLSGRRGIWLMTALSPLVAFCLIVFFPGAMRRSAMRKTRGLFLSSGILIVAMSFFLAYVYGFDWHKLADSFLEGFDWSGDVSAVVRAQQFFALLKGWAASPWLGSGAGAIAQGCIRSDTQPWSYELSYLALLFHVGVIGFILYSSSVIWIYWMGIHIIRSGHRLGLYMFPILVGTTCFLIGNATNPYLAKFDYIWVIFLPVSVINLWLLDTSRSRRNIEGHNQTDS